MRYDPITIARRRGALLLAITDTLTARPEDAALLTYQERIDGALLRHEWSGCTGASLRSLTIQVLDLPDASAPYIAHCASLPHARCPFELRREEGFAARRAGDLSFCVALLEYWLLDKHPVWQRFDLWQPAQS